MLKAKQNNWRKLITQEKVKACSNIQTLFNNAKLCHSNEEEEIYTIQQTIIMFASNSILE